MEEINYNVTVGLNSKHYWVGFPIYFLFWFLIFFQCLEEEKEVEDRDRVCIISFLCFQCLEEEEEEAKDRDRSVSFIDSWLATSTKSTKYRISLKTDKKQNPLDNI